MITDTTVASDEIEIDASAELVWQVLIDFENYSEWNSFCPQATAKLELGAPINMMVDLGNGLQHQIEYISRIEPNRLIAWSMANKPGDPIQAVRTQTISALSSNRCSYVSIDEFAGSAIKKMIAVMGKPIEQGFNRCAKDLKRYAEQQHNQQ